MTHEEKAWKIVLEGAPCLSDRGKQILAHEIAEALQDAFDLGYCAAGGAIYSYHGDVDGDGAI